MEKIERRTLAVQELRVADNGDGTRTVSWYPAMFDVLSEDLGGFRERLNRRAFTQTLQSDDVRALYNHDPNFVLGRNKAGTLDLRVGARGLHASVKMPDTQQARDLLVSIERGDVSAGSFAFSAIDDRWLPDEEFGFVREVRVARLYDVSVVTYPAYPATDGTVGLRALLPVDLTPLATTLMRSRAGLPIEAADRAEFEAVLTQLRGVLPADAVSPDEHSVIAPWRRNLAKLRLSLD